VFAQDLPITQQAIQQCVDRDYVKALATINKAVVAADEKNHPRTWYVKSYVHKELYKLLDTPEEQEKELVFATKAIEKSIELDPYKAEWNQSVSMLEYLNVQYQHLARGYALSRGNVVNAHVDSLFNEYLRLQRLVDPGVDLKEEELSYNKVMGQRSYYMWESDPEGHPNGLKDGEEYYRRALLIDDKDCDANYNLVVGFYNLGVHKIKLLNTTSDIAQLILTQEESINLFRKSLPYILKAYSECPNDINILRAMFYIHRALDREEESHRYAKEIERLILEQN
jgi:hypothetical protein